METAARKINVTSGETTMIIINQCASLFQSNGCLYIRLLICIYILGYYLSIGLFIYLFIRLFATFLWYCYFLW